MRKPTIKNLSKDLTETKKADKEKIVFDIIKEWLLEINENKEEFRANFLSDNLDKDFDKIKDKVGDFKNISKMSVLDFLVDIILGSKDEFFRELHEEYEIMREDFYKKHKEYKRRKIRDGN